MRILIVADEPGWIFERHANEIKNRLSEHEITIAYRKYPINVMAKSYDIVYVMDPMPLPGGYPEKEKTIMGLRCEFLYLEHPNGAVGLYENGFPGRCVSIKDKCRLLHVVNKNQLKVLSEFIDGQKLCLAQHGVNTDIFRNDDVEYRNTEKLRVGFAGRIGGNDRKGVNLIAMACRDVGCEMVFAAYEKGKVGMEKMPEFYKKIDVYACMSINEGLHNPTLEAGAMGVPVITTRCGAAEEMIINGESGIIVNRKWEDLAIALKKMKDVEIRKCMGKLFHGEITKNWSWDVRIEDFRKMFNKSMEFLS